MKRSLLDGARQFPVALQKDGTDVNSYQQRGKVSVSSCIIEFWSVDGNMVVLSEKLCAG